MKKLGIALLVGAALVLWFALARAPQRGKAESQVAATASRGSPASGAVLASPVVPSADRAEVAAREAAPETVTAHVENGGAPPPVRAQNQFFHALVLDAQSQRPISGARAFVAHSKASRASAHAFEQIVESEATSDGEGRLALPLPAQRTRGSARIQAQGYGEDTLGFDDVHDAPERAQVIELLPAANLELRVLDETGGPEWGAEIALVRPARFDLGEAMAGQRHQALSWSARSDAEGWARFVGVPAEVALEWTVLVDRSYGNAGRLALAPGETRRLEVRLGGQARLFGHVRDEQGALVPGLGVWLARAGNRAGVGKTESDAHGRFEFTDVPFETLALGLAPDESEFVRGEEIELTVDRPALEQDLVVTRGLFIAGRVVGGTEERSKIADVNASGPDGTLLESAALEEGSFRLGPLLPGEYLVSGSGSGFTAVVRAPAGASDVELPILTSRQLRIRIEGARGPFQVQVRDLERIWMLIQGKDEPAFALDFPPGRHALSATARGDFVGHLAPIRVDEASPAQELVLRLEPGARCTFVHRAARGVRALHILVDGVDHSLGSLGEELVAGAARTLLLPARPLVAELREGGRAVARESLSPAPGQRLRIELVPGR